MLVDVCHGNCCREKTVNTAKAVLTTKSKQLTLFISHEMKFRLLYQSEIKVLITQE